ncbi:hypothetical protein LU656_24190, partial [Pseudomonas sp. NMI1173_11]|nr:hypothetical protein [Pseudomonas sp. NMI1173_11]
VGRDQLNGKLSGQSHDELHHFLGHDRLASQEIQGYLVVQTLNSRYVVCDWAGDGARGCSKALH